jgi:hypothetical protein
VIHAAGRFHDPENWGESVGTRPVAGIGGRKYLLSGDATGFSSFGKTGTGTAKILAARPNAAAGESIPGMMPIWN